MADARWRQSFIPSARVTGVGARARLNPVLKLGARGLELELELDA